MRTDEKNAETASPVRATTARTTSAQTRRGLRLWELRKRHGETCRQLCTIRMSDPFQRVEIMRTRQTLERQIAELAGSTEATA